MKQVVADLKQIIDKSIQSENDEYQGESMMKAMIKVADLMTRYQKEIKEEQANEQKRQYENKRINF